MKQKSENIQSQHSIDRLNQEFFDGALSPEFVRELSHLPQGRPDVSAMVYRMFKLMRLAGYPATDLSIMIGKVLGTLLERILPGAWNGRVPPVTVQGRHKSIDQYIKKRMDTAIKARRMLDIGCGFPPYTTLETKEALTDWEIVAADPSLPAYLVYDEKDNYATFNENKEVVYFQPAVPTLENWNELLGDSDRTRIRFGQLLEELLDMDGQAQKDGCRLEINPIDTYKSHKLSFLHGGIGGIALTPVDCIRCFNVLYYFDNDFYDNALQWFETILKEEGILLVGGDWALSTECYYHEYQKIKGRLVEKEFAFSIDAICPFGIVTWYGNYEGNRQTTALANYLGILREDKTFMEEFYAFNDALRLKYGLCPRDERGYYTDVAPDFSPTTLWPGVERIKDELNKAGFNRKAAEVLTKAGYETRINEADHIAIILNNQKTK